MERFLEHLGQFRIFLGSRSPRRERLLRELRIPFTVWLKEEDPEDFAGVGVAGDIAVHLARKKADAYRKELNVGDILITADTVVILDDQVLTKPRDRGEAIDMLTMLSGREHLVITGVCLTSNICQRAFDVLTKVRFDSLDTEDVEFYVDHFHPYDKAGSYGIQEWIGSAGATRIEGSYFNVMGLPVQRLFTELKRFTNFV